jgi:ABC-2 type transport system permease protein
MLTPDEQYRRPRAIWAPFVRSSAFVRKELAEILRQPRLLLLLVLGPFLLLLLFGAGYSQSDLVLRAVFVGEEDSIYQEVLATYEEELDDFLDPQGFVTSEAEARGMLAAGDVDIAVVFPDDPVESVLAGERAVIRVLHDEIDPLQQSAIWISTRVAVQEVNAIVLSTVASEVQTEMASYSELVDGLDGLAADLEAADDDPVAVGEVLDQLDADLAELVSVVDGSYIVMDRLESDSDLAADLDEARAGIGDLRQRISGPGVDRTTIDVEVAAGDIEAFAAVYRDLTTIDPDVLVRPFASSTESILVQDVSETDYFNPSALALLLQHIGLTFAALSLVRDRSTGLFELLRVSPLSSAEIIIGKCTAYVLFGSTVAALLLVASVFGLGIPMVGNVAWLAVTVVGVVLASLALGMVFSMLSRTESQAVQFSMLSLLAGLFFSGFVLSIDDLVAPVRVISFLLPVTYGIRSFQDVMFRGTMPSTVDLAGLAGLTLGYGTIAVVALQRKLRIA